MFKYLECFDITHYNMYLEKKKNMQMQYATAKPISKQERLREIELKVCFVKSYTYIRLVRLESNCFVISIINVFQSRLRDFC